MERIAIRQTHGRFELDRLCCRDMVFDYKKNRDWAENLAIVMQVGLTMAGCIVFCFFVGRYIDGRVGSRGIFTVIFILLGVIGGANVVYRQILSVTDPDTKQDPGPNDGSS